MSVAQKKAPKVKPVVDFTLERSTLLAPLTAVAALAKPALIPILGYVRLDSDGEVLRISASDLDMWITRTIPLEPGVEPFSLCVEAARFADIVRRLPDGATIRISLDGEKVCRVASAASRYSLPVLPAEEFPVLEAQKSFQAFKIDAAALSSMLATVRISCSTDELRQYLNGVHIRVRRDDADGLHSALCVEATSGVCLSKVDADTPEGANELRDFIIPRQAVEYFLKLLAEGGEARIQVNERFVMLSINDATFCSKLVDGVFPDCDRVIPPPSSNSVAVNRVSLLKAVERLNAFHIEKKDRRTIALHPEKGRLDLSVTDASGDGRESLEVDVNGDPAPLRLNPRFLLDVLSQMQGENVNIETNGEMGPVAFRDNGDPNLLHIIMPVRV